MNTMKWLLRREFWENKGAMLWAPIVVGALMVLFVGISTVYGMNKVDFDSHVTVTVDGKTSTTTTSFEGLGANEKMEVAERVAGGYLSAAAPLYVMLFVIVFFYCLGALNEERRDRSILFWKSLPVSDNQTVLSKVITAALVAPLITITIATFVSLLLMLITGAGLAFRGINMFTPVLSNVNFYLAPLQILAMLPVYILFALPTIGWLLMVSAWAKSRVFLWAVGVPVISILVIKWANFMLGVGINVDWFVHNVVARTLLGLFPGSWLVLEKVDFDLLIHDPQGAITGAALKQSWLLLGAPTVWVGAIAGAAMIFVAMRLRRWKDEG